MSLREVSQSVIKEAQATFVSAYIPSEIITPSFEEAQKLDESSRWEEASDHLYTLARHSEVGSMARGDALIGLTQEMINLGNYRLAERCLSTLSDEVREGDSPLKLYLKARVSDKRGWIAEAFGKRDEGRAHFQEALRLVRAIPGDTLQEKQEEIRGVHETVAHFEGRRLETLAMSEKDPTKKQQLLWIAMNNFADCLVMNRNDRAEGKPKPANEAFQLEHMAILCGIAGNFVRADEFLESAKKLFEEFLITRPDANIMGHYYTTKGLIETMKAHKHFEQALSVYLQKPPYVVGVARARGAMAAVSLAQGNVTHFVRESFEAFKLAPQVLAQAA